MKKIKYIITIISIVFITSCDDDTDDTLPEIDFIFPIENEQLVTGTNLEFEAEFTDDTELKSYRIDIHKAGDHTHKSKSSHEFTMQKSWDFEEGMKSAHIRHNEVFIPNDTETGEYHILVYCADKAGNESWIAHDIEIVAPDSE